MLFRYSIVSGKIGSRGQKKKTHAEKQAWHTDQSAVAVIPRFIQENQIIHVFGNGSYVFVHSVSPFRFLLCILYHSFRRSAREKYGIYIKNIAHFLTLSYIWEMPLCPGTCSFHVRRGLSLYTFSLAMESVPVL